MPEETVAVICMFDFIVLFLGTNDLKACYTKSASDIGVSIDKLVIEIKFFIDLYPESLMTRLLH